MKFIISENRLNKLIGRFLDSSELKFEESDEGGFNLRIEGIKVLVYKKLPSLVNNKFIEVLYIGYGFENKLNSYFNITSDETIPGIIEWVNEKYGVNIRPTHWNWFLDV